MTNKDNNGAQPPETPESFPLDEPMIQMVQEFHIQQAALNGALMLFLRQHKLPGAWQIAENGKEIVRMQGQGVPVAPAPTS